MFKKFFGWLDKGLSWWFYFTGFISVATLSGFFSRMLALSTPWIIALGPFGVWLFTLGGVAFVLILIMLGIKAWSMAISARVHNKWKERVDSFNPLESTFHQKRIRISDLAHPSTQWIQGKRLIDCDLIGPSVIYLYSQNNIYNYTFLNCDVVVINPKQRVTNCIVLEKVYASDCRFYNCTIYVDEFFFQHSVKNASDINVISYTGDAVYDGPPMPEEGYGDINQVADALSPPVIAPESQPQKGTEENK